MEDGWDNSVRPTKKELPRAAREFDILSVISQIYIIIQMRKVLFVIIKAEIWNAALNWYISRWTSSLKVDNMHSQT